MGKAGATATHTWSPQVRGQGRRPWGGTSQRSLKGAGWLARSALLAQGTALRAHRFLEARSLISALTSGSQSYEGCRRLPAPSPFDAGALPSPPQVRQPTCPQAAPKALGGGQRGQSPPLPRPRFPHRRRIYFYSSLPGNARDDAGFSFLVVI